jgi:hypothetical protein
MRGDPEAGRVWIAAAKFHYDCACPDKSRARAQFVSRRRLSLSSCGGAKSQLSHHARWRESRPQFSTVIGRCARACLCMRAMACAHLEKDSSPRRRRRTRLSSFARCSESATIGRATITRSWKRTSAKSRAPSAGECFFVRLCV